MRQSIEPHVGLQDMQRHEHQIDHQRVQRVLRDPLRGLESKVVAVVLRAVNGDPDRDLMTQIQDSRDTHARRVSNRQLPVVPRQVVAKE